MLRARTESRVSILSPFGESWPIETKAMERILADIEGGGLPERYDVRATPGHWIPAADPDGSYHVTHTRTGQRVEITVKTKLCACKVANGLNRAYGYDVAPCYDEGDGSDDCHGTGKVSTV